MKTENAKIENAKNENASAKKPGRVRMNYKVGELPHVFFNNAAPEGARAGEHARVQDGVLWHEQGVPAAAFLRDATAQDGRRVAAVLPLFGRWASSVLLAAVPEQHARLQLKRWPAIPTYHQPAGACELKRADRCSSAAHLVAAYMAAIERDALASVHSADDTAGENPQYLRAYVEDINALLALRWSDAVAQERARVAFNALRARWQLASNGEHELAVVRAVAQQAVIERNARNALPVLQSFFQQRAARSSARERAQLIADSSPQQLRRAIADVLRAGLPPVMLAGLPANMAGTLTDDELLARNFIRVKRAPAALSKVWAEAVRTESPGSLRMLPNDYREMPARWRERFEHVRDFAARKTERAQHRAICAEAARAAAAILPLHAQAVAYAEAHEAGTLAVDDAELRAQLKICASLYQNAADVLGGGRGARARTITNGRAPWLRTAAVLWLDRDYREGELKALAPAYEAVRAHERMLEQRDKLQEKRDELAELLRRIESTPRAAQRELLQLRNVLHGWGWQGVRDTLPADADELFEQVQDALQRADARMADVSVLEEWKNGGLPPSSASGDWLLVGAKRARTTRGAEVPTRAVRYAFAVLDAEPELVVDFRNRQLMIGSFQLLERRACGGVQIGCHFFSADAVQHAREQLAKIGAQDDAQEAA